MCNRDHDPPNLIFCKEDRDYPIILPTHKQCNSKQSVEDSRIGNLFRVLRGEYYKKSREKLSLSTLSSRPRVVAISGLDFPGIIRRWVQGFHASLYHTFLPVSRNFSTTPPLPRASEDGVDVMPLPEVYPIFVYTLKKNRIAGSIDQIVCRNGTCTYECVWVRDDQGRWMCIYALDIYNWIRAAPSSIGLTPRGCVGAYWMPDRSCPILATTSTELIYPVPNSNIVNPFSD
jgi:hypothetical protein